MISAALTSFLTGITEPIEFSFLFVAPLLYAIHALLAGVAYFICIELGIKHGMTFSHGLIDFVVLFNRSTHGLWFLVLGPLWALMYYGLFRSVIRRFDLKTPGREVEADADAAAGAPAAAAGGLAGELVRGVRRTRATSRASTPASRGCACELVDPVARESRSSEGARRGRGRAGRQQPAGDLRHALGEPEERHGGLPAHRGLRPGCGSGPGCRRGGRATVSRAWQIRTACAPPRPLPRRSAARATLSRRKRAR